MNKPNWIVRQQPNILLHKMMPINDPEVGKDSLYHWLEILVFSRLKSNPSDNSPKQGSTWGGTQEKSSPLKARADSSSDSRSVGLSWGSGSLTASTGQQETSWTPTRQAVSTVSTYTSYRRPRCSPPGWRAQCAQAFLQPQQGCRAIAAIPNSGVNSEYIYQKGIPRPSCASPVEQGL